VGAGAIGCEFACIFNELGTRVTLVEMLPQILPMFDGEVANHLKTSLARRGIGILTGTKIVEIRKVEKGVEAKVDSGEELLTQMVLVSVGRSFNSRGIGLEELGIGIEEGKIKVNDQM